jgi:hypothetical protein
MGAMFAQFGVQAAEGIVGGLRANAAYKSQAAFQDVQTRQLQIQGAKEAADIRKRLLETQSMQTAYFASSGIDITSGSPMDLRATTQQAGDEAYDISKLNTAVAVDSSKAQAKAYRLAARNALISGLTGIGKDTAGLVAGGAFKRDPTSVDLDVNRKKPQLGAGSF